MRSEACSLGQRDWNVTHVMSPTRIQMPTYTCLLWAISLLAWRDTWKYSGGRGSVLETCIGPPAEISLGFNLLTWLRTSFWRGPACPHLIRLLRSAYRSRFSALSLVQRCFLISLNTCLEAWLSVTSSPGIFWETYKNSNKWLISEVLLAIPTTATLLKDSEISVKAGSVPRNTGTPSWDWATVPRSHRPNRWLCETQLLNIKSSKRIYSGCTGLKNGFNYD